MNLFVKICIGMANVFQLYIVFTVAHMIDDGINQNNIIMLLFNIAYIVSFQTYNKKIDELYQQRGKYFSSKYDNASQETKNIRDNEICEKLFCDVFNGDFRE